MNGQRLSFYNAFTFRQWCVWWVQRWRSSTYRAKCCIHIRIALCSIDYFYTTTKHKNKTWIHIVIDFSFLWLPLILCCVRVNEYFATFWAAAAIPLLLFVHFVIVIIRFFCPAFWGSFGMYAVFIVNPCIKSSFYTRFLLCIQFFPNRQFLSSSADSRCRYTETRTHTDTQSDWGCFILLFFFHFSM